MTLVRETLPHLFESADIELSFDEGHIGNLVSSVRKSLSELSV